MRKIDWSKVIAGAFAVDRIHSTLKQFFPQYADASDNAIHRIKRKLGMIRAISDEIRDFVGKLAEDSYSFCLKEKHVKDFISILIAEECKIIKIANLDKDIIDKIITRSRSIHTILDDANLPKFSEHAEIRDAHINFAAYAFPSKPGSIQIDIPNTVKKDAAVEELLRPRKYVIANNAIIFFTYQDRPGVILLAEDPDKSSQSIGYYFFGSGNENEIRISQSLFDKLWLCHSYNRYAGCIVRFCPSGPGDERLDLAMNYAHTKELRLLERTVDMNVYDETTRRAVEDDVISFTLKTEAQEPVHQRRSYLLVGPPGCGKSQLIQGIITKLPIKYTVAFIEPNTVMSLMDLIDRFNFITPLAIIIEDVDLIIGKTKEKQVLLNFLDGVLSNSKLITIMTANNPAVLGHVFLRRPGRVDRVIKIMPGDITVRIAQLRILCKDVHIAMDLEKLASKTEGFTFAQHRELIERAKLYSANSAHIEEKSILCSLRECKDQFSLDMKDWSSFSTNIPSHIECDIPQIENTYAEN